MTSVVHEYSILYSERLVQKDKRWVDGTLRYYTFNSKVEVVSADQWVVGTDFKPHAHFEEGAQYKMGGLLVEIVELTTVYERDIASMFTRDGSKRSGATGASKNKNGADSLPETGTAARRQTTPARDLAPDREAHTAAVARNTTGECAAAAENGGSARAANRPRRARQTASRAQAEARARGKTRGEKRRQQLDERMRRIAARSTTVYSHLFAGGGGA